MTLGECEICKVYLCSCNKRIEMAVKESKREQNTKRCRSYCGYPVSVTWYGTHTGTISRSIQIKIESQNIIPVGNKIVCNGFFSIQDK